MSSVMRRDETDWAEVALIGRRLSAAMAVRGVSADQLADVVGVRRQTIWRYQTARSAPSFPVMAKIAKVLAVRLEFLAYGSGSMEVGR